MVDGRDPWKRCGGWGSGTYIPYPYYAKDGQPYSIPLEDTGDKMDCTPHKILMRVFLVFGVQFWTMWQ
jgi:hypothetical protein